MELLLNIGSNGPDPDYQDGDIVCAFNERRILHCHAEIICDVSKVEFTSEGLNPIDCLAWWMAEICSQYKFERLNATQVRRTNLLTAKANILSNSITSSGEYIDVESFIARKRNHASHSIFGTEGKEIWFGGRVNHGLDNVKLLWDKIEEHSDFQREDCQRWPLTDVEQRRFLGINVNHAAHNDDCDDGECDEHVRSIMNDDGITEKQRAWHIDYWDLNLPNVSTEDVRNREKLIDIRDEIFDMETVCSRKDDPS